MSIAGKWISRGYIAVATAAVLGMAAQNIAHAQYLESIKARVHYLELRDMECEELKRLLIEVRKRADSRQEEGPRCRYDLPR